MIEASNFNCELVCREEGFKHLAAELPEFNFALPYPRFFGGAALVSSGLFRAVNGYSNEYWGWGGEDDDLALRIMRKVGLSQHYHAKLSGLDNACHEAIIQK